MLFDRQGWITVVAAVLLALITLFTGYDHVLSFEPLPSIYRSKQEFLASLPPWRRLLQKLNWHPLVDLKVQRYALEQEINQLDEINAKLAAILSSSATNSTPPPSTPDESET